MKRKIALVQGSLMLGSNLIGIFFPFLLAESFGLDLSGVLWWMASMAAVTTLLMHPVLRLSLWALGARGTAGLGLLAQGAFYGSLSILPDTFSSLLLANSLFVLHIILFWPVYHVLILHNTSNDDRGRFFGTLQIIQTASGLGAPVVTGFLLSFGYTDPVLIVGMLVFVFGAYQLAISHGHTTPSLASFGSLRRIFFEKILPSPIKWGMIADGIQTAVLWVGWPWIVQIAVGGYAGFGIIKSLGGLSEIITARISGVYADRVSSRNALPRGIYARIVDLGIRGGLAWFPSVGFAVFLSISGAILGPLFNITSVARLYELQDQLQIPPLEFFVLRELMLGIFRTLTFGLIAIGVSVIGMSWSVGLSLIIAGLSSLLFFGYNRLSSAVSH